MVSNQRWATPLGRFVRNYGAEGLAKELQVTATAIYAWVGGKASPRARTAGRIVQLAAEVGRKLTFDEIYSQAQLAAGRTLAEIIEMDSDGPIQWMRRAGLITGPLAASPRG